MQKGFGVISKIENNSQIIINDNNQLVALTLYGIKIPRFDFQSINDQEPKGYLACQFLRSYLGKKVEFSILSNGQAGRIFPQNQQELSLALLKQNFATIDLDNSKPNAIFTADDLKLYQNQYSERVELDENAESLAKIQDLTGDVIVTQKDCNIEISSGETNSQSKAISQYTISIEYVQDNNFVVYVKSLKALINFKIQYLDSPIIGPQYLKSFEDFLTQNLLFQTPLTAIFYQKAYIPEYGRTQFEGDILQQQHQFQQQQQQQQLLQKESSSSSNKATHINIPQFLLQNGFSQLNDMAYFTVSQTNEEVEALEALQETAKSNRLGLFKNIVDFTSLMHRVDAFCGVVLEVETGNQLRILNTTNEQTMQIQLSKIKVPLGLEPGAFEAREFLRKNTIGKEVNVFLEKEDSIMPAAQLVLIGEGGIERNIAVNLVENGLGVVREDLYKRLQKDATWQGALQAQESAREKQIGIHLPTLGVQRFQELAKQAIIAEFYKQEIQDCSKSNKSSKQLQQKKMFQGVIEGILDNRGDCFKVRFLDPLMVFANVSLALVKSVYPQQTDPDFVRLAKEAHDYAYRHFMHRDVLVQIIDNNESGFIGHIQICSAASSSSLSHTSSNRQQQQQLQQQQFQYKDLAVPMLEEGLLYICDSAEYSEVYDQAEKIAKKTKLGIWGSPIQYILQQEIEKEQLTIQRSVSKGTDRLQILVSEIVDTQQFYVQKIDPESQQILQQISNILQSEFQKDKEKQQEYAIQHPIKKDTLCAAKFSADKKWYRVKIIKGNKDKGKYLVEYIDFGNQEEVDQKDIRKLPQSVLMQEPQATLCSLAFINMVPQDHDLGEEALEKFREMVWEKDMEVEFQYKKEGIRYVMLGPAGSYFFTDYINSQMVALGYARVDRTAESNPFCTQDYDYLESEAKENKDGLWNCDDRLSDDDEDGDDDYEIHIGPTNNDRNQNNLRKEKW